jgi:hypothetical protein
MLKHIEDEAAACAKKILDCINIQVISPDDMLKRSCKDFLELKSRLKMSPDNMQSTGFQWVRYSTPTRCTL